METGRPGKMGEEREGPELQAPGTGFGLVPTLRRETRASVPRFSSLEQVTASSTWICRLSLQGTGSVTVTRGRRNPPAPPWEHPLSTQQTAGTARYFSTPLCLLFRLLQLCATPSPDPRGRRPTPARADGAAILCAHAEGTRRSQAKHTPATGPQDPALSHSSPGEMAPKLPPGHHSLPTADTATVQPESRGKMARESRILRREEVEVLAKTTL